MPTWDCLSCFNSLRPSYAYICINKLTIIGSDNSLSTEQHQAIIWTNAGILLMGFLGTNFSEILSEIHMLSIKTRRSENDNTAQPLDQWTNSPFIGQQVGTCKSSTLTHYLADLFNMHHGPRSIPLCIQHYIQLTSLSFQVSRPSHSWDTTVSIFYFANPRSRSWVWSKFEVAMWV